MYKRQGSNDAGGRAQNGGGSHITLGGSGSGGASSTYISLGLISDAEDDSKIFFGSGGGSEGDNHLAHGGDGGGIMIVYAKAAAASGSWSVAGLRCPNNTNAAGGAGAGGTAIIRVETFNSIGGSSTFTTSGGAFWSKSDGSGQAGGEGRAFINYVTLSSGSMYSATYQYVTQNSGVYGSRAIIQSTNLSLIHI